jgi:hypothetical protein
MTPFWAGPILSPSFYFNKNLFGKHSLEDISCLVSKLHLKEDFLSFYLTHIPWGRANFEPTAFI